MLLGKTKQQILSNIVRIRYSTVTDNVPAVTLCSDDCNEDYSESHSRA